MTDVVTIGNATLYCGDCREIIGQLMFDSIVTDPPYGIGTNTMQPYKRSCNGKKRNLHAGGTWAAKDIYKDIDWDGEAPDLTFLLDRNVPMIFFGGNYFAELPPSRKWIIWDKGETHYRRTFSEAELAWCSFDGNTRIIKHIPDYNKGFSNNGGRIAKVHPTQKPVKVMEYCISELPKGSGNIVCDPYMGSGTTGVAAIKLGRVFVGIEQKKKYFDIACERIRRAVEEYQNQFPEVRERVEERTFFEGVAS